MSDHDFEKQVNQKLEELKLRPSDTVWMEVEKNIRQHKRRRHFLWLWTAALFITLTTSGVVLYHYTSDTKITTEMAQAKPATLSNESTTVSPNSTNTNLLINKQQLYNQFREMHRQPRIMKPYSPYSQLKAINLVQYLLQHR